jgi:hypothetical protein
VTEKVIGERKFFTDNGSQYDVPFGGSEVSKIEIVSKERDTIRSSLEEARNVIETLRSEAEEKERKILK